MKAHGLAVCSSQLLKARPIKPDQWWGIGMNKVMAEGFGWISVVIVLDWHTKKAVGHYSGLQARAGTGGPP